LTRLEKKTLYVFGSLSFIWTVVAENMNFLLQRERTEITGIEFFSSFSKWTKSA